MSSHVELFAEASYNRNKQRTVIQPVPISALFALPPNHPLFNVPPYNGNYPPGSPGGLAGTPTGLTPGSSTIIMFPNSPFYPTSTVQGLVGAGNPLVPITVLYRANVNGNRDFTDIAESPRVVLGARGDGAGWDYDTALLYSASKVREQVTDGYPALTKILPILNSGNVNFWGPSAPDVEAQLRATNFTGDAFRIKSELGSVQCKASRELLSLAGGAMALALGAEYRKEKFLFDPDPAIQTGDIAGYGGNLLLTDKSRDVEAAFGELNMPLAKGFELNAAVRLDHYQGVGDATTPKVSARWQPLSSLLLRGAVGKGFRAPSLQDLYLPVTNNVTPAGTNDPIRCPVTGSRTDCSTQFTTINGGNPDLKPEKSTNATLGFVFAPTSNTSVAVDAFKINLKDTIVNGVTASTILGDLDKYGSLVTRGPVDPAFPTLPGPIVAITQTQFESRRDPSGRHRFGRSLGDQQFGGRQVQRVAHRHLLHQVRHAESRRLVQRRHRPGQFGHRRRDPALEALPGIRLDTRTVGGDAGAEFPEVLLRPAGHQRGAHRPVAPRRRLRDLRPAGALHRLEVVAAARRRAQPVRPAAAVQQRRWPDRIPGRLRQHLWRPAGRFVYGGVTYEFK